MTDTSSTFFISAGDEISSSSLLNLTTESLIMTTLNLMKMSSRVCYSSKQIPLADVPYYANLGRNSCGESPPEVSTLVFTRDTVANDMPSQKNLKDH